MCICTCGALCLLRGCRKISGGILHLWQWHRRRFKHRRRSACRCATYYSTTLRAACVGASSVVMCRTHLCSFGSVYPLHALHGDVQPASRRRRLLACGALRGLRRRCRVIVRGRAGLCGQHRRRRRHAPVRRRHRVAVDAAVREERTRRGGCARAELAVWMACALHDVRCEA